MQGACSCFLNAEGASNAVGFDSFEELPAPDVREEQAFRLDSRKARVSAQFALNGEVSCGFAHARGHGASTRWAEVHERGELGAASIGRRVVRHRVEASARGT